MMSNRRLSADDWTTASSERLRALFAPRSVALIGVSDNNDMSRCVYANMKHHGFSGPCYLINPNRGTVHGQRAIKSLTNVGEPVDLAFALVSGARLLDVMEEAGACGVRSVCVLGGGFSENGADGALRQRRLVEVAAKHQQVVLGPNTIGYLNVPAKAVFYGSPLAPPVYPSRGVSPGNIGAVVQSGIIAHAMLRGMLVRNVGPSLIAATGNEANLAVHEVIDYLVDDEATRVITLFIETVRDHEGFRRACRRALDAGKPIVAMKAGRSAVAAKTAISHTGALVGDSRVYDAAFEKYGVIAVTSLDDLLTTAAYLSNYGAPTGRRAALVSVSGGFCEMFADRAAEVGIELPDFSEATTGQLTQILPDTATALNPLDTTGAAQTDTTLFPRAMEIIARDPGFDALFVQRSVWASSTTDDSAVVASYSLWAEVIRRSPIPVVLVGDLMAEVSPFEAEFRKKTGLPAEIGGLNHGLAAFAAAAWWATVRQRHSARKFEAQRAPDGRVAQLFDSGRSAPWAEYRALQFLEANGVPVVPWKLAETADDAARAADALGYPVAIKVSSAQLPHKSAIGGVILDVIDAKGAGEAFEKVMGAARRVAESVAVDGALVMPMRERGTELIVGIVRDRTWGLILAVGFGGVWTEVLNDSVITPLPADADELRRLVLALRGARLLSGGHGLPAVNIERLIEVIACIAAAAVAAGDELESLEVNPVRADGDVIEAIDSLIVWRSGQLEG